MGHYISGCLGNVAYYGMSVISFTIVQLVFMQLSHYIIAPQLLQMDVKTADYAHAVYTIMQLHKSLQNHEYKL